MPLNFPVQASVPPLSGVFQQCIARRTKRLAPCPMHAPTIPAHHEGNGFDLLFLVQALSSFLFYMQLAISNCLAEEKAGHLYEVCLKFAAWCRYALRRRRNVPQHRLQPYSYLFFLSTATCPSLIACASAIQAVMGAISDFLFLIQASDLFLLRILVSHL